MSICSADLYKMEERRDSGVCLVDIVNVKPNPSTEDKKMNISYLLNSSVSLVDQNESVDETVNESVNEGAYDPVDCILKAASTKLQQICVHFPVAGDRCQFLILDLFRHCLKKKEIRISIEEHPAKMNAYLAGCILACFQERNIRYSFKEVGSIFRMPKQTVLYAYREVTNVVAAAAGGVPQIATDEAACDSLAKKLQYPADVVEECKKRLPAYFSKLEGRSCRSIIAITVYLTGVQHRVPNLTRKDVAILAGVSDVTLWTLAKLVHPQTNKK